MHLYLDIETIPTSDPLIIERVAANVSPPASMKKADTIAAWEAEKKPEAVAEAVSKTGLNGAYGQVAFIGFALDDDPVNCWSWPLSHEGERHLLASFSDALSNIPLGRIPTVVGHNIANFDLRFLWQRAMVLGICMPSWLPREPKPWGNDVFDTMTKWAGARDYIKMDELCFALGIEGKGDVDGSMVGELFAAGEYQKIADYCVDDVEKVRRIHKRMQIAFGEA
jgi:predicted PolB exonuclease-like 3'-5' exonuclease